MNPKVRITFPGPRPPNPDKTGNVWTMYEIIYFVSESLRLSTPRCNARLGLATDSKKVQLQLVLTVQSHFDEIF